MRWGLFFNSRLHVLKDRLNLQDSTFKNTDYNNILSLVCKKYIEILIRPRKDESSPGKQTMNRKTSFTFTSRMIIE